MRIDYKPADKEHVKYTKVQDCYLDITDGVVTQRERYVSSEDPKESNIWEDAYRDYETKLLLSNYSSMTIAYLYEIDVYRIWIHFAHNGSIEFDTVSANQARRYFDDIYAFIEKENKKNITL